MTDHEMKRVRRMKVKEGTAAINPAWLKNMNPEQTAAILHHEGPVALLATAGSGKTRALVHRIVRLIVDGGVDAATILAVTFSRKAADEMQERIEVLADELRVDIDASIGTWHALCLSILREDNTHWSTWTVDEKDQHKWIVKEVLGYKYLDWKTADLTKVRSFIGWCKAHLYTWEDPEAMEEARRRFGTLRDASGRPAFQLALDAFSKSQEITEDRGLLTFDDFLVFAHRHLTDEDTRLRWAAKWNLIMQDEAQDENRAQKEIGKFLAQDHRNYMKIGDPAQSIFGFRGSTPEYLMAFEKEWGAKTIIMNRNYRSGSKIIEAANNIIRPATVRLPADMIPERGTEGAVKAMRCADFDDEAKEFASWVEQHTMNGGKPSDVTCLFRTNAQSRALEEELLKRQIPYVIVGGHSFYDRREVKDILGYVRVAAGMDREGDAIKRCINAPFRFLGARFVDKLMDVARSHGFPAEPVSWSDVVSETCEAEGIQSRQRASAQEWTGLMNQIVRMMAAEDTNADKKPVNILSYIVNQTKYIAWLEKEEGEETIESSGGANVRELIRVSERFSTVKDLLDYIEKSQAAAKKQKKSRSGGERVLLMSIHRSKGLEWPKVWVVGNNEMILPHAKGEIEEERRLAYVAATRAQDELVLSFVNSMATRAGMKQAKPSRFLVDAGLVGGTEFGQEGYEL